MSEKRSEVIMNTSCKTCTRHLVDKAYQRCYWFFLLREPLKCAMRIWVRLAKIDLTDYTLNSPFCHNCNRFYKNALKDQSPLFCKLNDMINPTFDGIIEKIVGPNELQEAKKCAHTREEAQVRGSLDRWTRI
jgi:hypothetical protein